MLLTGHAWAEDSEEAANAWRIVLEPKFMRRPVSYEIAHAQQTVLAPALLQEGELVFPSKEQFASFSLDQKAIEQLASVSAEAELKTLQPRYVRDKRKIIEFAELSSSEPIVASAVLAPGFLKMFQETIGDSLLLVVPNRYRAFIFPRLASHYEEYTAMVFEAFRATAYPVSVEVFEVSADGMRAIGVYEEP
jgi:hypothetical protein